MLNVELEGVQKHVRKWRGGAGVMNGEDMGRHGLTGKRHTIRTQSQLIRKAKRNERTPHQMNTDLENVCLAQLQRT